MLTFNNLILLGSFHTSFLVNDTFGKIECRHGKLKIIIKYNNFNRVAKLDEDKGYKVCKMVMGFIFGCHESSPCKSRFIINNSQKNICYHGQMLYKRSPNVYINDIKISRADTKWVEKRVSFALQNRKHHKLYLMYFACYNSVFEQLGNKWGRGDLAYYAKFNVYTSNKYMVKNV